MQDVIASLDRLLPTLVVAQIGSEHREVFHGRRLGPDRGSHPRLAGDVPHRGPYPVAASQQLDQTPAPQKPGTTRYENRLWLGAHR
jgi:hypothetical protein